MEALHGVMMAESTENPLAGVLICVYGKDHPEWFREALQSIVSQTYPRERIRIYLGVDGPLGPGLEEVIAHFRGNIHKIVRSEARINLPAMLNRLIGSLEEESLLFRMDSDDICHLERFEEQVREMAVRPDLDILGTAIQEFDPATGWSKTRLYPVGHEELKSMMHLGLPVAHPTVCIRRKAMDRLKGYSTKTQFSQDVEIWFRAMSAGMRFGNLPKPLLLFRCNRTTLTRRSRKKAFSELRLYLVGCYRLFGPSPVLVFPFARFVVRMLPQRIIRALYTSKARHILLGGKTTAQDRQVLGNGGSLA